jgi:hypothetical protein
MTRDSGGRHEAGSQEGELGPTIRLALEELEHFYVTGRWIIRLRAPNRTTVYEVTDPFP